IFSKNVAFQIDRVARFAILHIGMLVGVGDDSDLRYAIRAVPARDGQADAIHSDRALGHEVARKLGRYPPAVPPTFAFRSQVRDLADSVDVTQHKVTAKFLARGERLLEVHARSNLQSCPVRAERGSPDGFAVQISRETTIFERD